MKSEHKAIRKYLKGLGKTRLTIEMAKVGLTEYQKELVIHHIWGGKNQIQISFIPGFTKHYTDISKDLHNIYAIIHDAIVHDIISLEI